MMLRSALLAATILALPAVAMAQPITGLYVGAGVGATNTMETNLTSSFLGLNGTSKVRSNGGFIGLGSVGYGLGNGVRIEVEGNYRNETARSRGNALNGGGTIQTYGGMLNALYDFDMGHGAFFTPYVGVGIGYELLKPSPFASSGSGFNVTTKSGDKGSIAGQAILGAAFPIRSVPGLSLTTEYRFLGASNGQKFPLSVNGVNIPGFTAKLASSYNNSLLVGLRYAFNAAAPAPVAAALVAAPAPVVAPAPAPARSYLVFFDWDKADLTSRAQQIIAEAAQNSTRVAATRIEVAGHADKSGTPAYNQTLSLKRANNVAAELVRLGVSSKAISITAFGDTKPLVPTAAGVREPQNRRVEIVLK
jgi:outer membrane protein OmpA-like peptidoglycan-associated protein